MNYNDLQIKILQYLRNHPKGATGKELANFCHVSLNTIRREFSSMFDCMKEEAFELESKPSHGYRLCVKNETQTKEFFEDLITKSNNPLFENNTSQNYKVNYIIRRLLTSNDYILLTTLSYELNYSESSLRRDLKVVEKKLEKYHLQLKQKKQHGFYIEGDELSKRLCLISQHKFFVNLDPSLQKLEPNFIATFSIGDMDIRQCVLKVKKEIPKYKELSFKLIDFPLIYQYIPIIRSRKRFSNQIVMDVYRKKVLQDSEILNIAANVLYLLYPTLEIDDNEIIAYGMFLQAFRSVTDFNQLNKLEQKEILSLSKQILEKIDSKFQILDELTKSDYEDFSSILYSVGNKIIFNISMDEESFRPMKKINPFVQDLCIFVCDSLQNCLNKDISIEYGFSFYFFFESIFERKTKKAISFQFALISTYGNSYAKYCKNILLETYSSYIRSIQVFEYSQLDLLKHEEFDYLISDMRKEMVPVDWKKQSIHLEILTNVNRKSHQLENKINELLEEAKDALMYFYNGKGKDINEILSNICVENNWEETELKKRLYYNIEQNHEYTLFLSISDSNHKPGIYFYQLEKEFIYKQQKIHQIVICSYQRNGMKEMALMKPLLQK